ncbi:hypothetical protein C4C32_18190 [Pseudomonas corrugata]|uniref:Uncharacterized protein n=1 Tax=Pseudomonas corrugata TaxID=47879 RepID=A0A8B6UKT7_9PSED|nr:hypothetical protein [Pseudomonas corrugata]QTH12514.1 hypothetical protein C4C32_18190 [Pseudomonas corrugata]
MKDPHGTVERLTNALESMATKVGATSRAQDIYITLSPLVPNDFPNQAARDLFERIISSSSRSASHEQSEYEDLFSDVWKLYWLMSSNSPYR